MKYVKKWMVVPFLPENESEFTKNVQLSQVIGNNNESADKKVKLYNQINNKKRKQFIKDDNYQPEPVDEDPQNILTNNAKRILNQMPDYRFTNIGDNFEDSLIENENPAILNQSLPEQSLIFDDEFESSKKVTNPKKPTKRISILNKSVSVTTPKQIVTVKNRTSLLPNQKSGEKLTNNQQKFVKNTSDNLVSRTITPESAKRKPSDNTRQAAASRSRNVKTEWVSIGNRQAFK